MKIEVVRAGFLTTVQDLGRAGYRASGISPGGALDTMALRVANLVVGNDETAAGIETTMGQLQLSFQDQRTVCWCGGSFDVDAAGAKLAAGRPAFLHAGDELRITAPANGARAWIAISGGVDVLPVLGSRATDLRSNFGGLSGRVVRDGDALPLGGGRQRIEQRALDWSAPNEWAMTTPRHPYLRVVRGADGEAFDEAIVQTLLQEPFTVTAASDRMGARLEGPRLDRIRNEELLSEPVIAGTIQVPPDGQPILLLGDCQTIGGYPKIAHVITVDLSFAAQLRPGNSVRFAEVSLVNARRLYAERERDLAWFRAGVALRMQ